MDDKNTQDLDQSEPNPDKRLVDLDPRWVGAGGPGITRDGKPVPKRTGVGISFDCPCGCGERAYVGFKNPTDGGPAYEPDRPKWERDGEDFETLTLRPSILRKGGCAWHGFLTGGVLRHV